eukprot:237291_1
MYRTLFTRRYSSTICTLKALYHLQKSPSKLIGINLNNTKLLLNNTKLLLNRMNRIVMLHPVITGALFTGIQAALADLLVQNKVENKTFNDTDWTRNAAFFLYYSHISVFTYFMLVKCYPFLFPLTKRYSVHLRVLFDQMVISPFVYYPAFYTCKCLVFEKKSFGYTKWKKSQSKYWNKNIKKDVSTAMKVWAPAHFITFKLIPNHLKLFWVSCVSFGWIVILSAMRGSNDEQKIEKKKKIS